MLYADAHRQQNGEIETWLATTIALGIGGKVEYALEGSIFIAGAAVVAPQWIKTN
jgi:glycerol kinase